MIISLPTEHVATIYLAKSYGSNDEVSNMENLFVWIVEAQLMQMILIFGME